MKASAVGEMPKTASLQGPSPRFIPISDLTQSMDQKASILSASIRGHLRTEAAASYPPFLTAASRHWSLPIALAGGRAKTEFQNTDRRLILSRFPFFKQSGYRRSNSVNGIWLAQESVNTRAPSFFLAVISRKHKDCRVAPVSHAPHTQNQLQPAEAR